MSVWVFQCTPTILTLAYHVDETWSHFEVHPCNSWVSYTSGVIITHGSRGKVSQRPSGILMFLLQHSLSKALQNLRLDSGFYLCRCWLSFSHGGEFSKPLLSKPTT